MSNPIKKIDLLLEEFDELKNEYDNLQELEETDRYYSSEVKRFFIKLSLVAGILFITAILLLIFIKNTFIRTLIVLAMIIFFIAILNNVYYFVSYKKYRSNSYNSKKLAKTKSDLSYRVEKHRDILNKLPFNVFDDKYDLKNIVTLMRGLDLNLDQAIENYDELTEKYLPVFNEEKRLDKNRLLLKENKDKKYLDIWREKDEG